MNRNKGKENILTNNEVSNNKCNNNSNSHNNNNKKCGNIMTIVMIK